MSDDGLVRRARAGDEDAFARLALRHQPTLQARALRVLGDAGDAQDSVQETLFAAWRGIGSFRGQSSFRTWVLVLGRHEALRYARRGRPRRPAGSPLPVDVDRWTAAVTDRDVGPEGGSVETALLVALDDALLRLPEGQRSVWVLREIEHLSYAEIATTTGLSVTSVRGLLQRARVAVASRLHAWR